MSLPQLDGALRLADLFLEGIQDRRQSRALEKTAIEHVELYHGTPASRRAQVLREGLRQEHYGAVGHAGVANTEYDHAEKGIFLTPSKRYAREYAVDDVTKKGLLARLFAKGQDPFKVRIPPSHKDNLRLTVKGLLGQGDEYVYKGDIPAEWVKELEKTAKVSPYQQKTEWTCSAASLATVIQHYGGSLTEEEAVPLIGAQEGRGAEVTDIVEGAIKSGFEAFDHLFSSLEEANVLLELDIPIICDIQSFNHEGKGHYVVLHKIDEQGCHLMDPNTPGNERVISKEHMDACWWDYTMAKPHELREKWGVVVLPPEGSNDQASE